MVGHYVTPTLAATLVDLAKAGARGMEGAEIWLVYWWPGVPSSPVAAEARDAGLTVREFWMAGPARQARRHGWWRGWRHWWETNRAAYRAIADAARELRGCLGLLCLHNPWYAELMALAAARPRLAAVKFFTATEWPVPWHKRLGWFVSSLLLDRVVVNSDEARKVARALGHFPAKLEVLRTVDIVARGMDAGLARPERVREMWGIPEGAPTVGAVSRLDPVKGHDVLLRAWPAVLERHPEARLLVVGGAYGAGDPIAARLEALAADLRIGGSVTFTGMRADVLDHYAAMDVVAHPSRYDLFPFTVLEAMQLGRAVVATEVGGIPEMVEDGADGVLVPPEDEAALAAAISDLLDDPARRAALGAEAARRVAGKWTVERAGEEALALYNRILLEKEG